MSWLSSKLLSLKPTLTSLLPQGYTEQEPQIQARPTMHHPSNDDEPEIIIAVMGSTGTGKSSFIETVTGCKMGVGDTLKACTADVATAMVMLDGHNVMLVDTPGFDDTFLSDTQILGKIATWMEISYRQDRKLNGIIFLHNISHNRMAGSSLKNFNMFQQLCGPDCFPNVLLVTTMWSGVEEAKGKARQDELRRDFWGPMVSKGSKIIAYDRTLQSAHNIVRGLYKKKVISTQIQKEIVSGKSISQTKAGLIVNEEAAKLEEKFTAELATMQAMYQKAKHEKDQAVIEAARKETERLQAHLIQVEKDRVYMRETHEEAMKKLREDIAELTAKKNGKPSWGEIWGMVRKKF